MQLAVFGPGYFRGKEYDNYSWVEKCIEDFLCMFPDRQLECLWSGGGKGVEQLALKYAALARVNSDVYPPNIRAFGAERAFKIRNSEILKVTTDVLLLWDGRDVKYPELMAEALELQRTVVLRHVE